MRHRVYVEEVEDPPIELIGLTMSRSGNTAIGHWLLQQFTNGVHRSMPPTIHGPWDKFRFNVGGPIFNNLGLSNYQSIDNIVKHCFPSPDNHKIIRTIEDFSFNRLRKSNCEQLIKQVNSSSVLPIGASPIDLRFLLIIRDPYNWFASRLSMTTTGEAHQRALVEAWKSQARMCNKKKLFGRPFIVIKYNKWVVSKEYRRKIAIRVCGKCTFNSIGTNYNKTKFVRSAHVNPEVAFNRWEETKSKAFNFLISSEEIEHFSNQIFNYPKPF